MAAARALARRCAIETLFPLALFSRRARVVLVPAGLVMLVGIRLLMGPTFEQFMMCYVFWVPWASVAAAGRARVTLGASVVIFDGGCGLCSRTESVLRRLDLLATAPICRRQRGLVLARRRIILR